MLVRAVGLAKSFRSAGREPIRVLAGVDLEAKPGEFVAIVGASGSGKSTLLNLLGLLEPADAGDIWFDDLRVSHLSRRAQARVRGTRIGYVFQSFLLISGMTALENILLAARYVGRGRRAALADAHRLMARLEVSHRSGHYPAQLSGGEQQRVAYCRAVLNQPPLVLADEPTGSVDDAHARVILAELRALAREQGTSVIVVTHRTEAAAEADRIVRLHDGRLEPAWGAPKAAPRDRMDGMRRVAHGRLGAGADRRSDARVRRVARPGLDGDPLDAAEPGMGYRQGGSRGGLAPHGLADHGRG
jgi:ABC-type lipoprotein export system ATPase subunit